MCFFQKFTDVHTDDGRKVIVIALLTAGLKIPKKLSVSFRGLVQRHYIYTKLEISASKTIGGDSIEV